MTPVGLRLLQDLRRQLLEPPPQLRKQYAPGTAEPRFCRSGRLKSATTSGTRGRSFAPETGRHHAAEFTGNVAGSPYRAGRTSLDRHGP